MFRFSERARDAARRAGVDREALLARVLDDDDLPALDGAEDDGDLDDR